MSEKKKSVVEKHALDRIPEEERIPWYNIALIWIGSMICVPGLMIGGTLITGLSFTNAVIAGILGYTIIAIFMTFQGMEGADLGLPTAVIGSSAFGKDGARILVSSVLAISLVGWFGVQANIAGSAFSRIINSWLGINFPIWLSSLVWGIIMLTTAIIGYNALQYLNYVAVPALLVLSIYGAYVSIQKFGIEGLINYQPPEPFSLLNGIALAVGTFAVGGSIAADYSRYAKNRGDAVKSSVIGMWPAGVVMLTMGAVMAVVAGNSDITIILSEMGFSLIALIILILATWTTNTVNAYSGGLAVTSIFNLKDEKRAIATAVTGLLGTILAIAGILNYFVDWLILLTTAIPPVVGVMIADYWIINKGRAEQWQPKNGINWIGIISWLVGFIIAFSIKIGISSVNGILASLVVYILLAKLFLA